VVSPGLAVAPQKNFFIGLEENDLKVKAPDPDIFENGFITAQETFFTQIHSKGKANRAGFSGTRQSQKVRQQQDRHIVDTVKAGILQSG
jgi:hypothetical protein